MELSGTYEGKQKTELLAANIFVKKQAEIMIFLQD